METSKVTLEVEVQSGSKEALEMLNKKLPGAKVKKVETSFQVNEENQTQILLG